MECEYESDICLLNFPLHHVRGSIECEVTDILVPVCNLETWLCFLLLAMSQIRATRCWNLPAPFKFGRLLGYNDAKRPSLPNIRDIEITNTDFELKAYDETFINHLLWLDSIVSFRIFAVPFAKRWWEYGTHTNDVNNINTHIDIWCLCVISNF